MIPDLFLVSPLFSRGKSLREYEFNDLRLDGKLFLMDRGGLYRLRFNNKGKGELKSEKMSTENLREVGSLGVLLLSPSSEDVASFLGLVDYQLKSFLEGSPKKNLLLESAFRIFLLDKLSITVENEGELRILEENLSKEHLLSNISYFCIDTEHQIRHLVPRPPDNGAVVRSLVNLAQEIALRFFNADADTGKFIDHFYRIINSLVMNQLIVYAYCGYRNGQLDTVNSLIRKFLIPRLNFAYYIDPNEKIFKLKKMLDLICDIYEHYAGMITGIEVSFEKLEDLLKGYDKLSGETDMLPPEGKLAIHFTRNYNITNIMYANIIAISYLYFAVGLLCYLIRVNILDIFSFFYNFVNMITQVNDIINCSILGLSILPPSEKVDYHELLFKIYDLKKLNELKNFCNKKLKVKEEEIKPEERGKFYNITELEYIKGRKIEININYLRNSSFATHGVLLTPPTRVDDRLLDEKFKYFLERCYILFNNLNNVIEREIPVLTEISQPHISYLGKLIESLAEYEEGDVLEKLKKLLQDAEDIQAHMNSLIEKIGKVRSAMHEIAGEPMPFASEINKIMKRIYIYIPEFFMLENQMISTQD